jgi:hypothetical protein
MKTLSELTTLVQNTIWQNRYISTAGVVPASLAKELLKEIAEREALQQANAKEEKDE